jgi:LacI family transcriptional regulator
VLTDSLAARGQQVVLSVTEDDPERELRDVTALRIARASCVVIVPSAAPRPATLRRLGEMTTIQLGRTLPGLATGAVLMDDEAGTRAAAGHLIALGHRRIAFIGGNADFSSHRDRLRGFEGALADAGLAPDESLVHLGAPRPRVGRDGVARLLRSRLPPSAVVLGSSELTLGALEALRESGVRWPEDLSVVGYGDPAWFALVDRGITTLRLPTAEVAEATAAQVSRAGASPAPHSTASRSAVERFTPTLVVRGSTGPSSR